MLKKALSLLFAVIILASVVPAAAAVDGGDQQLRFKGKVRWVESLGTYALLAGDGKKYHPVKQLPRAYQKDDLAVVVEGRLRPGLVGSHMYGPALEVLKIVKADDYVSPEEWEAVKLLLQRMAAFNDRDLGKLQAIDAMAAKLSREQFEAWLGDWGKYTLHYVEATNIFGPLPVGNTIEGICVYSRERVNSMAISGNKQFALMKFTLAKNGGKWRFDATGSYMPGADEDMDKVVENYMVRAGVRFGTTDLAKAKH
jgi:hypothetical protein